jgi:CheY-like chemotaxis protein
MSKAVKVLCVDDNLEAVRCAAQLLQEAGCEVRMCLDGPSALELAQGFCPEVCVLDLKMPGMTGEELALRLREQAGSRPMRCIALTGLWDIESQHRTNNAGFDEHLVKPVQPERLVEVVVGGMPAGTS